MRLAALASGGQAVILCSMGEYRFWLRRGLGAALLPLIVGACGGTSSDESAQATADGDAETDYNAGALREFRAAIPKAERMKAALPGGEPEANALTLMGDAELARLAITSAVGVNAPAVLVVSVLRVLTLLPPTAYDAAKKEFIWGPWDKEDGYGQVLAYIRKNPDGSDFEFSYALVRMDEGDESSVSPIIWGAGTPEKKEGEGGVGVTLWDFELNNAFERNYDPEYDAGLIRDQGRFAMLFGKGENDDGSFKFNVAVFRDFVSKDSEPGAAGVDLDYFYGHFDGKEGNVLDFVDWKLSANLCGATPDSCFDKASAADLASGAQETLSLRAAFFDRGIGRAEASVTDGDLSVSLGVVECWDAAIDRSYFSVSQDSEIVADEGMCAGPFGASLTELGVPSRAQLDADVLDKLDCVVTTGSPCE